MKAIEVTGSINADGNLALDQPIDTAKPVRFRGIRCIVLVHRVLPVAMQLTKQREKILLTVNYAYNFNSEDSRAF
jgi:hypothetical protein